MNDSSQDAATDIAKKFCLMFPNSIRLIPQKNKDHSGALNAGFSVAKGKYLKPIDADGWGETKNLPAFIDFLRNCDSDVV